MLGGKNFILGLAFNDLWSNMSNHVNLPKQASRTLRLQRVPLPQQRPRTPSIYVNG